MPSSHSIPVVETERLLLRGHRPEDLDDCAAMWGDRAVTRFIGGKPSRREEVWWRLLRYAGHWAWNDYGFWAVEEKATGRFLGDVGYADFKRELDPSMGDQPEMGWVLATHAHGRGIATEAVQAAAAWADRRFNAKPTFCIIDPRNLPSIRVAGKVGFREAHRATYLGDDILVFQR